MTSEACVLLQLRFFPERVRGRSKQSSDPSKPSSHAAATRTGKDRADQSLVG